MQEYHYFYIERVIISLQSGSILSLLTIRHYEGKSYRMFTEWLVEAHYLRMFLKISRIPHFTTLQKFADRIAGTILQRMITYFIVLHSCQCKEDIPWNRFIWIQSRLIHHRTILKELKLRKKKWIKVVCWEPMY